MGKNKKFLNDIELFFSCEIQSTQPLYGGDISEALLVILVGGRRVVIKHQQNNDRNRRNFECEARGLSELASQTGLPVVSCLGRGSSSDRTWMALEYVQEASRPLPWDQLAVGLARMHDETADVHRGFGCFEDNFIGSLDQSNRTHPKFAEFFKEERLRPLVNQASGLPQSTLAQFVRVMDAPAELFDQRVFPVEPSVLVHGDLWTGNVLNSATLGPVLIDPAVHYSHREFDLAFLALFASPPASFFQKYSSSSSRPLAPNLSERLPCYQLYPYLVHLVLFGNSYLSSVQRCLSKLEKMLFDDVIE